MTRRVAITGMGVISPLGNDLESFWQALVGGKSGVGPITRFDATDFPTRIAAEVKGFDPMDYMDRKDAKRMDRFSHLAVAAARQALEDAQLNHTLNRDDVGVAVGTGIGGIETFSEQFEVMRKKGPQRVSPFFVPMMIANMAAGNIAILTGARGPCITTTTACAASANAVGEAFRLVQRGDAVAMICGGTEAPLVPMALGGFCAMKALSERNEEPERASRPFDAQRDGFVMAEGAAMIVLEELEHAVRRGARIWAEMVGYGMSADAYHITAPAPRGEGGARAMRRALADAGLDPSEVQYINAHGTSTPPNDRCETEAIKAVFGEHAYRLAISSTKSMTGHLLGAAGALELVCCVLTIARGVIPPTINYEYPDPDCDLDYVPNRARPATVRVAMSNSFGFGGQNACLVVRAHDA